jgi:RNA polymerase sigma-70 factor (ECF subfamily)
MEQRAGDVPSEVLRAFARGDVDAFETLFRAYRQPVFGWAWRIVRDPAAAEDVTVETFWRLWQSHARFDPDREFGAWARRVAVNAAIDHLHRTRPAAALPERLSSEPPDPAERNEVRAGIARAFQRLPAKLRAAAMLVLVDEESYPEAAAMLDVSAMAVKTRVWRAVRLLRASLRKSGIHT